MKPSEYLNRVLNESTAVDTNKNSASSAFLKIASDISSPDVSMARSSAKLKKFISDYAELLSDESRMFADIDVPTFRSLNSAIQSIKRDLHINKNVGLYGGGGGGGMAYTPASKWFTENNKQKKSNAGELPAPHCAECGADVSLSAERCKKCGAKLVDPDTGEDNVFYEAAGAITANDMVERLKKGITDIFPHSFVYVKHSKMLGESIDVRFALGSKDEWENNILQNDPVHTTITIGFDQINPDGTMQDQVTAKSSISGITVKPTQKYMAYSHVKFPLRKKTGTPEKIIEHVLTYFSKLKDMIRDTIPNMVDKHAELAKKKILAEGVKKSDKKGQLCPRCSAWMIYDGSKSKWVCSCGDSVKDGSSARGTGGSQ